MLRGRRYLDKVRFYDVTQSQNAYGDVVNTDVDKGIFYCDVIQITGYRLMQYQQQGINYPVEIETREMAFTPVKGIWLGNEIIINSIVPDLRSRTWRINGYMQQSFILPTTTVSPTTTVPATTTVS